MEIQNLKDNIKVFYIKADTFPMGIKAAWEKLHRVLSITEGRKFFGISYPDRNGNIVYKAAAEQQYPGEADKFGLETFVIKKGDYLSETLTDWQKDVSAIGKKFQQMLKDPRIDKSGYCLEFYPNGSDVICMVKLDSEKINHGQSVH